MADAAPAESTVLQPIPGPFVELWRSYRQNRGALIGLATIVALIVLALGANGIAPYSPYEQYREFTLTPPQWAQGGSAQFLLGTDAVGRDILSRLIYGTRLSLLIGLISVAISLTGGVALGLIAGYFRGLTETIFSWPGVGNWLVHGVQSRDYPVVQGGILLVATIVISVNLLVDLLYGVINPRIRHA